MRSTAASRFRFVFCLAIASASLALTACGGGGGGGGDTGQVTAPPAADAGSGSGSGSADTPATPSDPGTSPAPSTGNQPPAISGTAATSVVVGQKYTFTPSATDPDQDAVTFTIANKPKWATFDPKTGTLSGQPGAGDAGTYAAIEIAATDGEAVAALPAFNITVTPGVSTATPGVTLAWTPPTQNDDGSQLTDLAGYKIHYGNASKSYTGTIDVPNPGISRYTIEQLPPGKYFMAMTAVNAAGTESDYSTEVTVTVN